MSRQIGYARGARSFQKQEGWGHSFLQKKRFYKELFILVSILVLCSLFYVWTRIEVIETGYSIGELRKEQILIKEDQSKLTLEAATLKSTERLERIGRQKFQLTRPKPNQVIFLSSVKNQGERKE